MRSRGTLLACLVVVVWVGAAVSTPSLGIWMAMGGVAVTLGAAILLAERPMPTALLRPSPRFTVVGATVGALMAAATYALYPVATRVVPFIASDTARLYAAFRAPSILIASVALVPVILGEELVWRGVVQRALVDRCGAWVGVTLAAGAYALVHVPIGSIVLIAAALACGLVWGTLRAMTGSLVPTLVAHLVWNGLVLLWLPLDSGL